MRGIPNLRAGSNGYKNEDMTQRQTNITMNGISNFYGWQDCLVGVSALGEDLFWSGVTDWTVFTDGLLGKVSFIFFPIYYIQ